VTEIVEKHYNTIIQPVITEKSTIAAENNQIVFRVAPEASKPEIREAVEALFKVKVKTVNTIVTKGKNKRFRGRPYTRSDVKKAIVTLEDGHSIDVTTGL
jgi:large subunit ribosomal protein L23